MELRFRYGEESIAVRVRWRRDRRSGRLAIHVEPDGSVLVDAPMNTAEGNIRKALRARAAWIHGHVAAARRRMSGVMPREYVSGESLLYLGRRYRLKVVVRVAQEPLTRLRGAYIEVSGRSRNPVAVRDALHRWYHARAAQSLPSRLDAVADSMRWVRQVPQVRLRLMQRQWGSCSSSGVLTLNTLLVKAPPECIEYVLVHELCHFRERNHGARFYALMDRHLPDWRARKERLDNLVEQILV